LSALLIRGRTRTGYTSSFKVGDQSSLDLIKRDLEKQKVSVSEALVEGKTYYKKKTLSFIFIGHVIDKDLQDTLDKMNDVGFVSGVEVVMSSPKDKSSVLMDVETDAKDHQALMKCVEKICSEKDFLLIRSL
jgi:ACT domain-containing protein